MTNTGIAFAIVLLLVFLFAMSGKSTKTAEGCCGKPTEGCCGRPTEGFALDLSPRGGYPNCKGCVITPVSFNKEDPSNLWSNVQGMGISPTMSGTVFRDWQTVRGNNMNRTVQSNNITLEEAAALEQPLWKNPYNYPAYAVSASSSMLPLQVQPDGDMAGISCSSCKPNKTGESYYHLFGTMHGNL